MPDSSGGEDLAEILVATEAKPEVGAVAQDEAVAIAGKDYERIEAKKKHLHWVTLIVLWITVCGGFAIAGTWLFHMIAPETWHYLSSERQEMLGRMLLSGITAIFGADAVRKWHGSI